MLYLDATSERKTVREWIRELDTEEEKGSSFFEDKGRPFLILDPCTLHLNFSTYTPCPISKIIRCFLPITAFFPDLASDRALK